jgi:hypothetical protein
LGLRAYHHLARVSYRHQSGTGLTPPAGSALPS